jgi:hypothetical protein
MCLAQLGARKRSLILFGYLHAAENSWPGLYARAWIVHHAHALTKNTGVKKYEWLGSIVRSVRGRERVAMEVRTALSLL